MKMRVLTMVVVALVGISCVKASSLKQTCAERAQQIAQARTALLKGEQISSLKGVISNCNSSDDKSKGTCGSGK
jgi:hypothetical protein